MSTSSGDIFQVVLAQRSILDLDAEPSILRVLRQVNEPVHVLPRTATSKSSGFTGADGAVARQRVISRPIAGTGVVRPRNTTAAQAAELIEHPKEIAEHVMLVDLARNDVGRVVEFGSLQIDEMMTLEKQPCRAPHVAGGAAHSQKAVRRSMCCEPPFPPARSRG